MSKSVKLIEFDKKKDKFSQLIEDLDNGVIGMTHIQIAIRTHTKHRIDIPDGIKDLLCGRSERDGGLILGFFRLLNNVIGTTELAYRRGLDEGP